MPIRDPPEPRTALLGDLALPFAQELPQVGAALVFLFPVLGAVEVPVFTKVGREGFGKEEDLDVIAARSEVFDAVDDLVIAASGSAALIRCGFDIAVGGLGREQGRGEGEEEGKMAKSFFPPWSLEDHDLDVEGP